MELILPFQYVLQLLGTSFDDQDAFEDEYDNFESLEYDEDLDSFEAEDEDGFDEYEDIFS
jgi:hypothetical protein